MSLKTCPKCNIEFKFSSMLKTHLKRAYHCLSSEDEITKIFSVNAYICKKCKKNLNTIQAYKRHIKETKCGKSQQKISNSNNSSNPAIPNPSQINNTINNNNKIIIKI